LRIYWRFWKGGASEQVNDWDSTFGHSGAYGTQAWIDPQTKLIYILMVQRANFPNSDASEVRKGFQEAASEAFAKGKGK
jgi:CubicO group peptidase (beta-lactamase class C family)